MACATCRTAAYLCSRLLSSAPRRFPRLRARPDDDDGVGAGGSDGGEPGAPAPGKLSPDVSKEMMAAIVATNKSLGLESWPMHDVKPCIDRGGQGITAKDVTPEETRKCAAAARREGLPGARKVVRAGDPDGGDRPRHRAGDRDRRQRRLGRLLVRSRPQVPAGEDRQPQQMGQSGSPNGSTTPARRRTTLWFPADKRACPDAAPRRHRRRRTGTDGACRPRPQHRHPQPTTPPPAKTLRPEALLPGARPKR